MTTTFEVQMIRSTDAPFMWRDVPQPSDFEVLDDAIERKRRFDAVPTFTSYTWRTRVIKVTREVVA